MLILKEPIKLKSFSLMVNVQDGFLDRLEGNYMLMQQKYDSKDLFYLLNQAPEVYVKERKMTTIVVNNQNQTNQKIRLEMIHNLFNRLMMAGTDRFTYQDAVFVQSMLAKLGVRNVSEFMKQIYEMQRDTRQVSQLSDLYETYMESVRTIVQNAKKYKEEKQEQQKEENYIAPLYWIHDEIFKRLQTGNVYHTISAFQKNAVNFIGIRNKETEGNFHRIMGHTWERFLAYHLQMGCGAGTEEARILEELNQINHIQEEPLESLAQEEKHERKLKQQVFRLNEENKKKWEETKTAGRQLQESRQVKFDSQRTRREILFLLEQPEISDESLEQKIQLCHKEIQTVSPEVVREEIGKPAKLQQNTEKTTRQVQTQRIAVKQQVHTQEEHLWKHNTENFSEVLQRGIQRQMERISDQVYRKLEKKLADERKRRGY